jgi:Phage MuF-C-terminal domain
MKTQNVATQNFAALVDAIVSSSLLGHVVAKEQIGQLGETPELLQKLALPNLPLGIKGKVIEKVVMDHGIPKSMLKRLAQIVASPQAVFRAADPHPAGVVVLSFESTGLGQVIVTIAAQQQVGRARWMNLVTSMYAKEDPLALKRWKARGLQIWTMDASPTSQPKIAP